MASPLDDLLNEVEGAVSPDRTGPTTPRSFGQNSSRTDYALSSHRTPPSGKSTNSMGVDELLADLDLAAEVPDRPAPHYRRVAASSSTPSSNSQILLGGSGCTLGPTPSKMRRVVNDKLRCTKCNRDVIRLSGVKWTQSVHYMQFREVFPNQRKLRDMTVAASDFAAYCCQCSWVAVDSIKTPNQAGSGTHISWVAARSS